MTPVLHLPGLGGSGANHWQSLWADTYSTHEIVGQQDWSTPNVFDWMANLHEALEKTEPAIVVAHSLGCAVAAQYLSLSLAHPVRGVMMVCPADVDNPEHTPDVVRGFSPMPVIHLPCPSVVVASTNDPYVAFDKAQAFASAWGSELVSVGHLGHVNEDSHLGDWQAGLNILETLQSRLTVGTQV